MIFYTKIFWNSVGRAGAASIDFIEPELHNFIFPLAERTEMIGNFSTLFENGQILRKNSTV
jgi:hypothetical protein